MADLPKFRLRRLELIRDSKESIARQERTSPPIFGEPDSYPEAPHRFEDLVDLSIQTKQECAILWDLTHALQDAHPRSASSPLFGIFTLQRTGQPQAVEGRSPA